MIFYLILIFCYIVYKWFIKVLRQDNIHDLSISPTKTNPLFRFLRRHLDVLSLKFRISKPFSSAFKMVREDKSTWKANYFTKIIQLLDEYPKCFLVSHFHEKFRIYFGHLFPTCGIIMFIFCFLFRSKLTMSDLSKCNKFGLLLEAMPSSLWERIP